MRMPVVVPGGVVKLVPWRPRPFPPSTRTATITKRQAQVLDGLCDGLSNAEIGAGMFVTHNTVKTTAKALYRRLGARNRNHAVCLALTGQVAITVRVQERRRGA